MSDNALPPSPPPDARVALVTGASSGIGDATARALHDAGFLVYAAARRTSRMSDLADRGIRVVTLDLTDESSCAAAVETIIREAERIDVLVNNAGYGSYGAVEDVDLEEGRRQFEVNVFGLAALVRLVLPHMRSRGVGRIVNVSSMGGRIWEPLGAWYHASKFAVEGFSDSLRAELGPFGIDVVVIQPGPVRTEWGGIAAAQVEAASGLTAYAAQARRMAKALRAADTSLLSARAESVAAAILRAATSPRPRTRYPVGSARLFFAAERVLPDRGFDRFIGLLYRFA